MAQINGVRFFNEEKNNDFYLDDIQFNVSGANAEPLEYKIEPTLNNDLWIKSFRKTWKDDVNSSISGAGMININPSIFLSAGSLENGLQFKGMSNGNVLDTANIKSFTDFLQFPTTKLSNTISNGSETLITLDWTFEKPIRLKNECEDYLSWTVQDDLSNLSLFRIAATGWEQEI